MLLTRLASYFEQQNDWIVVELNPELDMLEYFASSIYEKVNNKLPFIKKEFGFSFNGISFSLSGDKPVSNIVTLLEKMFEILKKQNKRILICVDEIANKKNVKTFVQQFQIFLRKDYPVYLLMTGLYENVRDLQNEKTLTFLYRAPRINISPLNLFDIAESFEMILGVSKTVSIELSKMTKGFAFAYQALGYIMYKHNS